MFTQRNPNGWSCLLASFANTLGIKIDTLVESIGHDGGGFTHVGLPEPMCRRGFHPQEMIKVCLERGISVTRVEVFPNTKPKLPDAGDPVEPVIFDTGGWEWFKSNLFNTHGVVECRTNAGLGHAMSYQGMKDHAMIYDSGTDEVFEFYVVSFRASVGQVGPLIRFGPFSIFTAVAFCK